MFCFSKEKHCSENAFRQAKLRLVNSSVSNPNLVSTINRTATMGYAPDAAWHAIRRHLQIYSFDDQVVGVLFSIGKFLRLFSI